MRCFSSISCFVRSVSEHDGKKDGNKKLTDVKNVEQNSANEVLKQMLKKATELGLKNLQKSLSDEIDNFNNSGIGKSLSLS
jgi:hypothetical protein